MWGCSVVCGVCAIEWVYDTMAETGFASRKFFACQDGGMTVRGDFGVRSP